MLHFQIILSIFAPIKNANKRMNVLLPYLSAAIGILAVVMAIVVIFTHYHSVDDVVSKRKRWAVVLFVILALYHFYFSYHYAKHGIEIFNFTRFFGTYYVSLMYFYYASAFNNRQMTSYWRFWIPMNDVPVFAIVLLMINRAYFNNPIPCISDYGVFSGDELMAQIKMGLFVVTLIGCLTRQGFLVYYVYKFYKAYMQEMEQAGVRTKKHDIMTFALLYWSLVLILQYISFFESSAVFRCLAVISFIPGLYLSFKDFKVYCSIFENNKLADEREDVQLLDYRLKNWAETEPFPLSNPDITIDYIAKAIHIDRKSLQTYFANSGDTTFTAWLSERRLEYCMRHIAQGDEKLSDIALKAGYSSPAALSKAFRKKYGTTPSEYRESLAEATVAEKTDESAITSENEITL